MTPAKLFLIFLLEEYENTKEDIIKACVYLISILRFLSDTFKLRKHKY